MPKTPVPSTLAGIPKTAAWLAAAWVLLIAIPALSLPPPPEATRLSAVVLRCLLLLLLGLAYGSFVSGVTLLFERIISSRLLRELLAAGCLLLTSALFIWGALSMLKFRLVGAHLNQKDLWFVLRSVRQVTGEGTQLERFAVFATLILPVALWATSYVLSLRFRHRPVRTSPFGLLLLSAMALLGSVFAGNLHPAGTQALYQLFPESSILTMLKSRQTFPNEVPPESKLGSRIEPYVPEPLSQKLNVLVVMLESVPWDRVFGPKARPESIPNLLELAQEGIVFERAYATSTHSDYAQTSILASLHPRKFPHHDTFADLSYPRTLFWDPLVPLGYRSAVFSCQNEHWGNMIAFLKTPHLQLLRHSPDWPSEPRRGSGTETKVFEEVPIREFFYWLDQAPHAPFAVYLNFQATHFPYVVPPEFPLLYSPSEIRFPATFLHYPEEAIPVMENRFYNALHYVDWAIGKLVAGLRVRGLWEKTAILLVSDHGEAFYEHGLPTHGTTLFEEQVRTVLLLRVPKLAARVVREPVSVLDAVPTLYRALGLPHHGNFQGRNDVLDPGYRGSDRAILMTIQGMTYEDGLLFGRFKLIRNWSRRDAAFFDLELDPEERSNAFLFGHPAIPFLELRLRTLLETQLAYYRARLWEEQLYPPPLP